MSARRHRRLPVLAAVAAAVMLASVADVSPASAADAAPPAATTGPADVSAARAGLARVLAANEGVDGVSTTELATCPLTERKTIEGRLFGSGLDDRLGELVAMIQWDEYESINPAMTGVWCAADSDGDVEDDTFGTVAAIFAVDLVAPVTFPDLVAWGMPSGEFDGSTPAGGGELASDCNDADEAGCFAVWHAGGLVIGLVVVDGERPVSQPTVDAALVGLVPDVIHQLGQA